MTDTTENPQPSSMGAGYTDDDKSTIKTAAMGAVALVAAADPGFLATIKESWAGSQALAKAPAGIRDILRGGGMPTPPQSSDPAGREQAILAEVGKAVQILKANPADLEAFKGVLTEAMDAAAQASKGVDPKETAVMDRVKAALNA